MARDTFLRHTVEWNDICRYFSNHISRTFVMIKMWKYDIWCSVLVIINCRYLKHRVDFYWNKYKTKLKDAHESAYLRQVNFYRRPFTKVMSGLSLGTCLSNLKSVALTVLNGSDWLVRCAQTHTHTHSDTDTHRTKTVSRHHSLRSLAEDNKAFLHPRRGSGK